MNTPRKVISPDDVERLFRGLVDSGELRFPKEGRGSTNDSEKLSRRLEDALRGKHRVSVSSAAELLRVERQKVQLKASRVAQVADISLDTYEALESGRLNPPELRPEAFARVLKALGIGLEVYLGVHGKSARLGTARNLTKEAALKHRPASRKSLRPLLSASWLAKLSDAMQS